MDAKKLAYRIPFIILQCVAVCVGERVDTACLHTGVEHRCSAYNSHCHSNRKRSILRVANMKFVCGHVWSNLGFIVSNNFS